MRRAFFPPPFFSRCFDVSRGRERASERARKLMVVVVAENRRLFSNGGKKKMTKKKKGRRKEKTRSLSPPPPQTHKIEIKNTRKTNAKSRGTVFATREMLKAARAGGLDGKAYAIQGFGNVGAWAAELFTEEKGRVVAVSDAFGATHNDSGLDIKALRAHVAAGGKLADFAGGAAIDKKEILKVDCDVFVPAAIGGVIDETTAGDVRAKYVVEAANGPTTPEGKEKEEEEERKKKSCEFFFFLLSPNPPLSRLMDSSDLSLSLSSPSPKINEKKTPPKKATASFASGA